jgi:predicted acetyltransferase
VFDVRACADQDEYGRAIGAIGQYFNPPPTEEFLERWVKMLPHERMHAAFEDGQIVGGAGAFPFELSVPGGSLPCAGVTAVGVHPTHRRRGVLRSMMDSQLRDVHERGEPIAALWASEETIYGRFG